MFILTNLLRLLSPDMPFNPIESEGEVRAWVSENLGDFNAEPAYADGLALYLAVAGVIAEHCRLKNERFIPPDLPFNDVDVMPSLKCDEGDIKNIVQDIEEKLHVDLDGLKLGTITTVGQLVLACVQPVQVYQQRIREHQGLLNEWRDARDFSALPQLGYAYFNAFYDVFRDVLELQLDADPKAVLPHMSLRENEGEDGLGADSLDIMEIAMAVEEKLGVDIPDSDVPKILTVGDLVDYVYALKKNSIR